MMSLGDEPCRKVWFTMMRRKDKERGKAVNSSLPDLSTYFNLEPYHDLRLDLPMVVVLHIDI